MKIGLISLGCPKNLVDSEVMLGLAQQAGHELTNDAAAADVLVVNTCAFIDSAKQESVDAILEMAEHKKTGACRRLVVTGCLAERYREELKVEIPEIDAVLGTGEVPEIVNAIGGAVGSEKVAPLTFYRAPSTQHQHPAPARRPSPSTGTIPGPVLHLRRGHAALTGHAETLRLPQDCGGLRLQVCVLHHPDVARGVPKPAGGFYRQRGAQTGGAGCQGAAAHIPGHHFLWPRPQGSRSLGAVAAAAERHRRPRMDPAALPVSDHDRYEALAAMADCEKVCRYIDLPLQHASNAVLRRMKRPGSRQKYDDLLANIRARVPGVALRTTFIVGFPGETDDDVAELVEFVNDHRFDHVGVFTYSHEEGTSAHKLDDDVPGGSKAARRARVMGAQKRLVRKRNRQRRGERVRVLIDGPASDHELVLRGRLETQAPDIDASVFLTECDPSSFRSGDFVEVEIVGTREYDLIARPVNGGLSTL